MALDLVDTRLTHIDHRQTIMVARRDLLIGADLSKGILEAIDMVSVHAFAQRTQLR